VTPAKKTQAKTSSVRKTAKKTVRKTVKKAATKRAPTPPKRVKPPKSELYEVRRSKIQGRGAFAVKPIRTGQIIDEYWGQAISHEEADRRYDDSEGRHHTFLFVLDDETVLDARYGGNDARFINHSCDPNCETEIEDGHIYIKAIKPITVGTELAYDYRFDWQDEYDPEDVRYYACRCGTKKCRGTILRIPVYLRPTVKQWLAGNDVKRPRKPVRGAKATTAAAKQAATKKHPAERHAARGEKHRRSTR
jgi:uncharacterized protein